ncbi:hypothetical protein J2Z32_002038 [Paenibacillus turicensis]|uniref:Uncharacterized protein n=1 Tax=Paenibacillus turicensis TaxID=160487 RepID=A0ABS4FS43_9BACL|nr:hypothetical protein [Paenibacillus turicensis]MBP1905408.1 hypothetical protein [Paenibacillus turicensis]
MKQLIYKHYITLIAGITIICLLAYVYYEHQSKTHYKNYISQQLRQDFNSIREDLIQSEVLFRTILIDNKFTKNYGYDGSKTEAFALTYRSENIQSILPRLETLSYEMGYIDEYTPSSLRKSLTTISAYFDSKIDPSQPISNENRYIITTFRQYNSQLINALFHKTKLFNELGHFKDQYAKDEYALQASDPVWTEALKVLEETSLQFLKDHNLDKLSDILDK